MPENIQSNALRRWGTQLAARLNDLASRAWFAYLTIILLQVKVMFGLWRYGDLTVGDTASYFRNSLLWAEEGSVNVIWSPLYTAFLGTLQLFFDNAFWSLVAARLCIAVLAAVLVLAVLRRLLPEALAWLLAAWWVLLPITFDTVYSVHLFSALFPLAIFVVVAYVPGAYGRGGALGLFIVTTVLVRNEYLLATLLWAALVLGYEWMQSRKGRGLSRRPLALAYGLPVLLALLLIGLFYSRSYVQYPQLSRALGPKHTLNVCQIYAFNRIQQGDPWQKNPWTECAELIERDFGVEETTFFQAFRRNPRAMLGHLWWNAKLIPGGTQLALFNRYGGPANPDYLEAEKSSYVWLPFALLVFVIGFGLYRLWRERRSWWDAHLRDTAFVWLAMLCSVVVVVVVMLMQRPRPSYLFIYTLLLMALAGLGAQVLLRRPLARLGAAWMPVLALLALLLVPPHYTPRYTNPHGYTGQELRHTYEHLLPHVQAAADDEQTVIMALRFTPQLCLYLRTGACKGLNFLPTMAGKPGGVAASAHLGALGVDWIYLDGRLLGRPEIDRLRDELLAAGWTRVGLGTDAGEPWEVLASPAHASAVPTPNSTD